MVFEISCCFSFFKKKLQNSLSCSCIRSCGMRIRLYSAIMVGLIQRFMAYSTTTRSDSGQVESFQIEFQLSQVFRMEFCLFKFYCHKSLQTSMKK